MKKKVYIASICGLCFLIGTVALLVRSQRSPVGDYALQADVAALTNMLSEQFPLTEGKKQAIDIDTLTSYSYDVSLTDDGAFLDVILLIFDGWMQTERAFTEEAKTFFSSSVSSLSGSADAQSAVRFVEDRLRDFEKWDVGEAVEGRRDFEIGDAAFRLYAGRTGDRVTSYSLQISAKN